MANLGDLHHPTFTIIEGSTPLIGLSLGSFAGHAVGSVAEYFSGSLLILLGGYLWWSDADHEDNDEHNEAARAQRLINACGLALVGLALSISLDELAIGFSFGLGANLVGPILILIGLLPLAETLMSIEFVHFRGIAIVGILMIILAATIVYRRFATSTHTVAAIPASREEGES